jgi:hypothetical protein
MRGLKFGLMAAALAGAMACAAPASADTVLFQTTTNLSDTGGFALDDYLLTPGQSWGFTLSSPASLVSADATYTLTYDQARFFEDGTPDLANTGHYSFDTVLPLYQFGDILYMISCSSQQPRNSYYESGALYQTRQVFNSLTIHADYGVDDAGEPVTFSLIAVPEPGTWALMILGFGMAGAALRARPQLAA